MEKQKVSANFARKITCFVVRNNEEDCFNYFIHPKRNFNIVWALDAFGLNVFVISHSNPAKLMLQNIIAIALSVYNGNA